MKILLYISIPLNYYESFIFLFELLNNGSWLGLPTDGPISHH